MAEFNAPVQVFVEAGRSVEVRSARDASTCLLQYWRRDCADEAYLAAMKSCMKVLAGLAEPVLARDDFIRAARQAGMSVGAGAAA